MRADQRRRLLVAAGAFGIVLLVLPEFIAWAVVYYFGPLAILCALAYAVHWHDQAEKAQDEIWDERLKASSEAAVNRQSEAEIARLRAVNAALADELVAQHRSAKIVRLPVRHS